MNFEDKTATVTMKAGESLSKEACEKAFEGSKYKVKTFEAASG